MTGDAVRAAFSGAMAHPSRRLGLGPITVEVFAPGELLEHWLLPAFSRILTGPGSPPQPADWRVYLAQGREVPGMEKLCAWIGTGRAAGVYETLDTASGRLLYEHSSRFWIFVSADSGEAFVHLAGLETLALWERAAPLKALWHLLGRGTAFQIVHGGAVGSWQGGVLLAGPGGAGKSTTALACLEAGFAYLADDYCLVDFSTPPVAHQLYTTAKLRPENLHRFENLRSRFSWKEGRPGAKPTVFLEEICSRQSHTSFPIRALVLPKITGLAETTWAPCSPAQAWRALAPSTIAQLPLCDQETFSKLTALTRAVPAFELCAGTRLAGPPDAIRQILAVA